LSACQTRFPSDLDYAKVVEGTIRKRDDKNFAFLKTNNGDIYIAPQIVRKYNLLNNEAVKSLVVYDYNRRKETWNWTCVSINKNNN
jgi:transcription termination factor Rho